MHKKLADPDNEPSQAQLLVNSKVDYSNLDQLVQPPHALLLGQLDGNLTVDSDDLDLSLGLNPDNPSSPDFIPLLNSTPTQQPQPDSNPPGLFDSLATSNSASLQSWSDLDALLPFALTPVSHTQPLEHEQATNLSSEVATTT